MRKHQTRLGQRIDYTYTWRGYIFVNFTIYEYEQFKIHLNRPVIIWDGGSITHGVVSSSSPQTKERLGFVFWQVKSREKLAERKQNVKYEPTLHILLMST